MATSPDTRQQAIDAMATYFESIGASREDAVKAATYLVDGAIEKRDSGNGD